MLCKDGHQLLTSQKVTVAEQSVKVAEQKNHPGYLNERMLCNDEHHSLTSQKVMVAEQNERMAEQKTHPGHLHE